MKNKTGFIFLVIGVILMIFPFFVSTPSDWPLIIFSAGFVLFLLGTTLLSIWVGFAISLLTTAILYIGANLYFINVYNDPSSQQFFAIVPPIFLGISGLMLVVAIWKHYLSRAHS